MSLKPTQNLWPFGPAPQRECAKGGEHEWKIIDLFGAAEPPAPSFQCAKCGWRWSRGWTKKEFRRSRFGQEKYYAPCIPNMPDEPPYAEP